jgi:hypothetical protein
MPEVISIFESRVSRLHTTHSWEFLGLETRDGSLPKDSLWRKAKFGADVIIGSFDSGAFFCLLFFFFFFFRNYLNRFLLHHCHLVHLCKRLRGSYHSSYEINMICCKL